MRPTQALVTPDFRITENAGLYPIATGFGIAVKSLRHTLALRIASSMLWLLVSSRSVQPILWSVLR